MKVLDVKGLEQGIDATQRNIESLKSQIEHIQQAVKGIVSLEDVLKGQGGRAIRSFYADCHEPFLLYVSKFLIHYGQTLSQLKDAVHSFEPATDGFVRQQYLEHDVEKGLQKVENVTIELTDAVNNELRKVQDIISLPQLNDNDLLTSIQWAKNKKNETIEQLHALDSTQTNALGPVQSELTTMKNFVADMQNMFQSGGISIGNYDGISLRNSEAYNEVLGRVNPFHSAMHKLDNIISYIAPYMTVLLPQRMFPVTYRGHEVTYPNIAENIAQYIRNRKDFDLQGMLHHAAPKGKVSLIENKLHNFHSDYLYNNAAGSVGNLTDWNMLHTGGGIAISRLSSNDMNDGTLVGDVQDGIIPDEDYILGHRTDKENGTELSVGLGLITNEWYGLDGFSNGDGQIGGGPSFSGIHAGGEFDTDIIDGNFGQSILETGVKASIGGKNIFPIAKAEGKVYNLGGRAQFDESIPVVGRMGAEGKVDLIKGKTGIGIEDNTLMAGAKVSLAETEGAAIFGIPWTDYNIKLIGGASAGSAGGEINLGKEVSLDLRFIFGVKIGAAFEKQPD